MCWCYFRRITTATVLYDTLVVHYYDCYICLGVCILLVWTSFSQRTLVPEESLVPLFNSTEICILSLWHTSFSIQIKSHAVQRSRYSCTFIFPQNHTTTNIKSPRLYLWNTSKSFSTFSLDNNNTTVIRCLTSPEYTHGGVARRDEVSPLYFTLISRLLLCPLKKSSLG